MSKLVNNIARRVLPEETYLNWQLDRINGHYRKLVEEARRKHRAGSDEVEALRSKWFFEGGMLKEELEAIATNKLRKQAYRLKVPFPSPPYGSDEFETEDWERGSTFGEWFLKPSGYMKVRAVIRSEQKERREALLAWIIPMTGLIGAITGLIAVLLTLLLK